MLHCPRCGETTSVEDSRATSGSKGDMIRRRRECKNCNLRFTTFEITEATLKSLIADKLRLLTLQDAFRGTHIVEEIKKVKSTVHLLEQLKEKS